MTLQLYYCINTLFTYVCILSYKLKVANDIEYVFDLKMKVSDSNLYFRRPRVGCYHSTCINYKEVSSFDHPVSTLHNHRK